MPSASPSSMRHASAPKHTPYVERPPWTPPTIRHGQIGSQLHDSKYAPEMDQLIRRTLERCPVARQLVRESVYVASTPTTSRTASADFESASRSVASRSTS